MYNFKFHLRWWYIKSSIAGRMVIRWMAQDCYDEATLVQVMAWCHQATSNYLNQCWPGFMIPYCITKGQWVKRLKTLGHNWVLVNIVFIDVWCQKIFSCDQAALWMVQSVCPSVRLSVRLSVCPSVRLSVTPFWLCSHHPIIMKFSGVITSDKSDVHAKGQGQRSKVKVTEVTTQIFVSGL